MQAFLLQIFGIFVLLKQLHDFLQSVFVTAKSKSCIDW